MCPTNNPIRTALKKTIVEDENFTAPPAVNASVRKDSGLKNKESSGM